MELWQGALVLLVGIAAGFANVMAGGGSLLSIPVLLFFGLPGPVANGTNRIAILAQNLTAVGTFFRFGHSDFRLSLTLSAAALPGAIAGAMVGVELDGEWFDRVVALVMAGVLIIMLRREKTPSAAGPETAATPPATKPGAIPRRRLIWGHVAMLGAGFWGGFIQIGVGFIFMPILHRVLGLDLVRVNMHKVFIILVYTIAALAIFASRVEIAWALGLALAAGNALGGYLGTRVTIGKGERIVRLVLYAALTAFMIKLLLF